MATVQVLRHIARGDLTHKLEVISGDEIGCMAKALNEAIESIGHTLGSVGSASKTLTSVSAELATSAMSLANGTQEQAASLEETSASLEQISVAVRHSCDNANQASQLASSSRDAAEAGGEVLSAAVGAMNEISTASRAIAAIVGAIDEITFQTNLLAVNASIEAAHAGEHGKGFAVVATEVRTLAQRSARAAQEIKDLVENSIQKVGNGSELVNGSGRNFDQIISSVKSVTSIVGEIAVDTREQTLGIEQVSIAMSRIDQVTQGNAEHTERLSETASKLAEQAKNLEHLVSQFVVKAAA
jgi:methyl-accepting chemotaxis protein